MVEVEIRSDSVLIEGYVNAVARDSRPIKDISTGKFFVEQIVPGAFERALKHNEVELLLNHDELRKLGSTQTNLQLSEDSIGLRARALITDKDVIAKARAKRLRGWSFGFYVEREHTEQAKPDMERRLVDDMTLVEVSLIDDQKIPAYEGTSVEVRAARETTLTPDVLETEVRYTDLSNAEEYARLSERYEKIRKD